MSWGSILFISFEKNIYHVVRNNHLILLDLMNDDFSILSKEQTKILIMAFEESSWDINDEGLVQSANLDNDKSEFTRFMISKNVISTHLSTSKQKINISQKYINSFLSWKIPKFKLKNISLFYFILAIRSIFDAKKLRKRDGFLSIVENINKNKRHLYQTESSVDINRLVDSYNFATNFFYSATRCLEWSAGLTFMLQKLNVKANFIVGIQTHPFISHAWVEINNVPIGNEVQDCDFLSEILIKSTFENIE